MTPLLAGIVTGAVPYAIDAITGGSSGVTEAQDNYIKKLGDFVNRLRKDAGKSTSDSLFYKSATKLLDDKYGEDLKRINALNATMGATNEAQLATMQGVNRGRNDAQVRTLGVADEKRKSLLDKADTLELEGEKVKVGMAEGAQQNLAAAAPMASSGIQALLELLKKPTTLVSSGQKWDIGNNVTTITAE